MVGVHDLWREDGKYLFLEIFLYILFLTLFQLFKIQTAHPIRMKLLLNFRVSFISFFIKRRHCLVNFFQLLRRCHSRTGIHRFRIGRCHIKKASHTNHEKLIQIARKNCHEFHSFQKGNGWILGFFQNSLIKFQPGQLSVLSVFQNIFFFIFLFLHAFLPPCSAFLLLRLYMQSKNISRRFTPPLPFLSGRIAFWKNLQCLPASFCQAPCTWRFSQQIKNLPSPVC